MTEDYIIKMAHIYKYKQLCCQRCQGKIQFDNIYKNKDKQSVYINLNGKGYGQEFDMICCDAFKYQEFFTLDSTYCRCIKGRI